MVKKVITFVLISVFTLNLFSQSSSKLDTIILYGDKKRGRILSINIFDQVVIKTIKGDYRNKNNKLIFINDCAIDSTSLILTNPFKVDSDIIFDSPDKKLGIGYYKVVAYNLESNILRDLNHFYQGSSYYKMKYLTDVSYSVLFDYNVNDKLEICTYKNLLSSSAFIK